MIRKGMMLIAASVAFSMTVSAQTPFKAEDAGLVRLVGDSVAWRTDADNKSNWEGYMSKNGAGDIILAVNTFADGDAGGDSEVAALVILKSDGSIMESWGFYGDNGEPYTENMDVVRTDGNPPSVAGDKRPGSRKFIVGNEATPMDFSAFGSDSRWNGNDYIDHIFAAQILEVGDNGVTKVSNVIDPLYGEQSGVTVGKIRKGGTIGLSNGNFVVMGEDRTVSRIAHASIIDGDTGAIVAGPLNLGGEGAEHSAWENLVAYDGGFAVRLEAQRNGDKGVSIRFYSNAGEFRGEWLQLPVALDDFLGDPLDVNNNPNGYTTTINEGNRGDDLRVRADIDASAIYYAGAGWDIEANPEGWPYLVKIDANSFETVSEIRVNELETDGGDAFENFAQAQRISMDVDPNGNVIVAWSDTTSSEQQQIVARIFNSDLEPVTPTFLVFESSDLGFGTPTGEITGIDTRHCDVAMTNDHIMVSARTQQGFLIDEEGVPVNSNVYTVFANPLAEADVSSWSVY